MKEIMLNSNTIWENVIRSEGAQYRVEASRCQTHTGDRGDEVGVESRKWLSPFIHIDMGIYTHEQESDVWFTTETKMSSFQNGFFFFLTQI